MTARFELRARYMEGWNELDVKKLVSAASSDFIFDDPAEALPVNKESLAQYMVRWDARTRLLGAINV